MTRDERGHDFERLFREDGPGVWRTIYAFTGGRRDLADEVIAEAFARAIARGPAIRDPIPWLYRTAFRLAAEELRRERRATSSAVEGIVDPPEVGELMAALRQLSPNQRAAVVLHYEADLPVEEVAKRMGTAASTVRVHLHRARKRLRELLKDDHD
ncbi:MAG TPA: sigma-70 family RNA polymerase sigma factor [Actinomycetota bacterium]